jgi:ATPase subunit of ABC transporter with duplicated ATPase domains
MQTLQRKTSLDFTEALASKDKLTDLRSNLEHVSTIELTDVRKLVDEFEHAIEMIERARDSISTIAIATSIHTLATQFEKDNELYHQLRKQQQVLSESLKREDSTRRRLQELEKIEREIKQLEAENDKLMQSRRTLRASLGQMRSEIFDMRVGEAAKINQEFGEVVLLVVKRAAHSKEFVARLSDLLAGSRIRTQGNIAEELAAIVSPSDLLQLIEEGDAQRLATLLGRDIGQVNRVVTYLRDHPDLYDLEGELFDDSLEITMFDQHLPKPVEQLSDGQRATALLPLILRSSSCPLIVDQPEDDLDNSFIFQVLVKNYS